MEIERKFLIKAFPEGLEQVDQAHVWQGYLSFTPEVRLRTMTRDDGVRHTLTIKSEGSLARQEVELPLDSVQFQTLRDMVPPNAALEKQYNVYRLAGGELLECSLVDPGGPAAFYYAEVEFPEVPAAEAFTPPAFLGREITRDPAYKMKRYCAEKAGQQAM